MLLVADGTRVDTISYANQMLGSKDLEWTESIPKCFLLNKSDLVDDWALSDEMKSQLESKYQRVSVTSAKTGDSVEEAFSHLVRSMIHSNAQV